MNLGIWSLLPITIMFILIFSTKRMLLALTVASLAGSVLLGGVHFASVWLKSIQGAFKAGTLGYLFVLLSLFGILIRLLEVSNYAIEFANWLCKFANSRKKSLLLTYLLGWTIFVDDYLNNMAVAAAMKRVCDKHKVSRTLFGFVVNATGATDCCIIPLSTWALFYSGLFEQYGVTRNGSGFGAVIAGIPYAFYPWSIALICFLVIIGVIPLIGLTKKDQKIAERYGVICLAEYANNGEEISVAESCEGKAMDANPLKFLCPIFIIIIVTIITGDVMVGCMGAILATCLILLFTKTLPLEKIFQESVAGVKDNLPVLCIITIALSLVEINKLTGMPEYIVGILTPLLSKASFAFPALVFAFLAVYSFFGGGFWDASMLFMPIVVPISSGIGIDPLLPCIALMCAAAAGSTTYVAGDAIMITSASVGVKPFYLMKAIFPYALIAYLTSIIAFLIAGMAWT